MTAAQRSWSAEREETQSEKWGLYQNVSAPLAVHRCGRGAERAKRMQKNRQ